jgi:hypothetical protein
MNKAKKVLLTLGITAVSFLPKDIQGQEAEPVLTDSVRNKIIKYSTFQGHNIDEATI